MALQVAKFEDRVRFNWGFHDATRDAHDGSVKNLENHSDNVYADGYGYGLASFSELKVRAESSDKAWEQYQAVRLEQLQALGFDDEADYAEHQRKLAQRKEMQKSHTLLVADGPWCLIQQ